jgi:hypothetical protein
MGEPGSAPRMPFDSPPPRKGELPAFLTNDAGLAGIPGLRLVGYVPSGPFSVRLSASVQVVSEAAGKFPASLAARGEWSGARVEKDRSVRPLGRAREVRPWVGVGFQECYVLVIVAIAVSVIVSVVGRRLSPLFYQDGQILFFPPP